MTGGLLVMAGAACMLVAAIDAFLTMVGVHRGGPLTNRWTRVAWRALLAVHRRRSIHPVLTLTGPLMMVGAILIWYTLLALGWFLVFAGSLWMGDAAVIVNSTGRDVGVLEHLYFVVSSLSTTGSGDLVAAGFPWTILANVAAVTATFLVTLSLTYVMPLVQAALEKQIIATRVFSVGRSPGEVVANSWTNGNSGLLDSYWLDVFGRLSTHAHQHSVYPILHFFHSSEPRNSNTRAILVLADAIHMLELCEASGRPPPGFLVVAKRSLHEYAQLASSIDSADASNGGIGPPPTPGDVRALGLEPVDDDAAAAAWAQYEPMRRALTALCRQDGWC